MAAKTGVETKIKNSVVRLDIADPTDLETDAFVYYAREDLQLGSGFGTAIALRGGPGVQEELKAFGSARVTDVVVTSAGNMKARHIIHAVGPKFQEDDSQKKLAATVRNLLAEAEKKGIRRLAMPAMGAGYYGMPAYERARITVDTVRKHLENSSNIDEVAFCVLDSKQFNAYQKRLETLS